MSKKSRFAKALALTLTVSLTGCALGMGMGAAGGAMGSMMGAIGSMMGAGSSGNMGNMNNMHRTPMDQNNMGMGRQVQAPVATSIPNEDEGNRDDVDDSNINPDNMGFGNPTY